MLKCLLPYNSHFREVLRCANVISAPSGEDKDAMDMDDAGNPINDVDGEEKGREDGRRE